MKTFADPRWKTLLKKFEKRIEEDIKDFDCWSTYVELPEICPKPEFCLISMEPGPGKDRKKPEYRNFIANKRDFILHYCAYHYLGAKGFNYQITDMAKGAIQINDAKKTQAERYRIWLPLLKNELELLGNPKIIFIGRGLDDLNRRERYFPVPEVRRVLHHAPTAARHVKDYFEAIPNDRKHEPWGSQKLPENIKEEVKEIAVELMEMHNYSDKLKDKILKEEFSREFTEQDKILLTVYRYDFEDFTNSK
jgi:hypothetical protein